jgi:hypothetical protein
MIPKTPLGKKKKKIHPVMKVLIVLRLPTPATFLIYKQLGLSFKVLGWGNLKLLPGCMPNLQYVLIMEGITK